jgi:hypothetical protein
LVVGRYQEALSLARKGGLFECEFIAAISIGNFREAASLCPHMLHVIAGAPTDRKSIVSLFELAHLVLFMAFAESTAEETKVVLAELLQAMRYGLEWIAEIAELFVGRKFKKFVEYFGELNERFEMSIHTAPVKAQLIPAIRENLVRNVVRPLARVGLRDIAQELEMSEEEVGNALRKLIREGRTAGKIDFAEGVFVAIGADPQPRIMAEMLERARVARQALEMAKWRTDYQEHMKATPAHEW